MKEQSNGLKFSTLAIHAGQPPAKPYNAVMTPVYQTSTYVQASPGTFVEGYDYGRTANPTRTALEENLAALEGAKFGLCFASGCAAMSAVLHSLNAGDHVVLCDDVYGGTFRLIDKVFLRMGITHTTVDMCDLAAVEKTFNKQTKLVWIETPTNPMLKVIDIGRIAAMARAHNCRVLVDNTFASPYLQTPLTLGADLVCHSVTKYIGGHSDVIGGALMLNDSEWAERLYFLQNAVGAVPAPWDCFLTLRSTKTLQVRMERHCDNARKVVDFLKSSSKVEKIYYPGLASHPNHDIARAQMRDFGGMLSARIKGGLSAAKSFLERLKIFSLAESLGGVESLAEHPAIMTHASIPAEARKKLGIDDGLIRLSVGIEDAEDLVADLAQALG